MVRPKPKAAKLLLLICGFAVAVFIRTRMGGLSVGHSPVAGLVFALCLATLALTAGLNTLVSRKIVVWGLVGAAVLCLPVIISKLVGANQPVPEGNYFFWSLVVSAVAISEEAFLRGALYATVENWHGEALAIIVSAAAFALLHIPLYGMRSLPLNIVVGLWLGTVRATSGSWTAPAITHTVADLAAWWLR